MTTTMKFFIFLAWLFTESLSSEVFEDLKGWLEGFEGGFVDPRVTMEKGVWGRGLYATRAIESGEALIIIPWIAAIVSKGDNCGFVDNIVSELKKHNSSIFWPYISTLPEPDIPNIWSPQERGLLPSIGVTSEFELSGDSDWTRHLNWWEQRCNGNVSDPVEKRAVLLMVTRSGTVLLGDHEKMGVGAMLPIYDLANHRNGHWTSFEIVSSPCCLEVLASRPIAKGEQLYNSYGMNAWDIFRDYGFVEEYPQSWSVGTRKNGGRTFEFSVDNSTGTQGRKPSELEFISEGWHNNLETAREFIDVATVQLKSVRLITGQSRENTSSGVKPERVVIAARFRKAYEDALSFAISVAERTLEETQSESCSSEGGTKSPS